MSAPPLSVSTAPSGLGRDHVASTRPRTEAQQPMMNFYRTKDDHWICVVSRQGNVDWPRICRAFGCEELIEDERCATPKARRNNAEETVALLDKGAAQFTKEELMARMDEEQLAWAPVQTLGEAAEDPQVLAAGGVVEVPNRAGDGTFKSPASPARFVGADDGPKGRAPLVGEHTEEVLSSIGYDKETIEKLIADAG